jgi:predicted metalloprotease with PDZ domain
MQTKDVKRLLKGRVLVTTAACLALGVAIAFAQNENKTDQKADAKKPAAERKNAADAAPQANARTEANTQAARRRGHGLGFDADAKDQGIRVTKVDDKGVAAQAGLKVNDRIVSIGGRPFTRIRPMQAYLSSQGGQQIPVVIERDGQQYTVQFTPSHMQDDSAWLGVYLEEGDANMKGARITQVYPAGPAARSGLWAGDIITRIGDEKIEDSADLVATVQGLDPQQRIDFAVLRNEQEVKIPVVLGQRDAFVYRDFDQGPQDGQHQQQGQQGQQGQQTRNDNDYFQNVPAYAMQLEHDRRNGEQHERIENEIRLLREEIAKLREELKKK